MNNPASNQLQQTVYIHRAVQKSIAQKKPSSYVPVADGFVTTSGSGSGSGNGSTAQPIQKIESLQK
jgi:hypothetical protein